MIYWTGDRESQNPWSNFTKWERESLFLYSPQPLPKTESIWNLYRCQEVEKQRESQLDSKDCCWSS